MSADQSSIRMEVSKPISKATLLFLLCEMSIATLGERSYKDRKRRPPSSQMYVRPNFFRRPIPDHRFNGIGRMPVPDIVLPEPEPREPLPEPPVFSDPSDLANIFGQCSEDPGVNVQSVFGGMFLSSKELDDMVLETQAEIQPVFSKFKKTNRFIEENRFQQTIGTVQGMSAPGEPNTCCETRLAITAPGKVMVDGKSMSVVHMNHSYQYVQEGLCTTPSARCRDIGICTQIYKYAFLLMYDPALVGKINPPVRYGRVQIKSHCECMNVGRVKK